MDQKENFLKGFIKENPLFVSVLGTCPALAVTTSLENALGMGVAVFFVLVMSNFIISLMMSSSFLKELVKPVRIPVYIVIIATLVTIVEMVMHAFLYDLYKSLGVFIPLIVVNCIILGRAEAFASNHKPLDSAIDGMGMALGYTAALMLMSLVREILGKGTITVSGSLQLDLNFMYDFLRIQPLDLFIKPVGAFMTFGFILAAIYAIQNKKQEKKLAKGGTK
ncbi:MAG: electron transport complex subunit E [Candidatus Izemoplasmatales bacterium]|nr:electron transport complex subunit E [Candidatus Izemoplasmatales bacterium]